MEHSLKQDQLGVQGKSLKLEIDPISHAAWTVVNKRYWIKEE